MNTKATLIVTAAVFSALTFGACRKTRAPASGGGAGGAIQVKGSDTLLMLSQRWAEAFMAEDAGAVVQVTGGGSGVGIKALIEGTTDIANASRAIKDEEKARAKAKGVDVNEVKVAVDGVCFIVNPSNPLAEVTLAQLGDIYRGEAKDWRAFGGAGRILCYGRQATSGTYDFVKEHVLNNEDYRADIQEMPGNSLLCDAVAKDKNGIAYVGVGYAVKRADVKILAVKKDAASPAIKPTGENVAAREYPLSRYLFNYTDGTPAGAARAFITFALSPEGQRIVEEVDYVALPADVRAGELAKLE